MAAWPDNCFNHKGSGAVKGYFPVAGGNLPLRWIDRNRAQLKKWRSLPLFGMSGKVSGEDVIMEMIRNVKKPDSAFAGAAVVNVDRALRDGKWRKALESMLIFWEEGGRESFGKAGGEFLYLRREAVELCFAEVKVGVGKKGKGKRKAGWEFLEFGRGGYQQEQEEGEEEGLWGEEVAELVEEEAGEEKISKIRYRGEEEREQEQKKKRTVPRSHLEHVVTKEREDVEDYSRRLQEMLES